MAMIALALPIAITAPSGVANAALPTGFQIKTYRTGLTDTLDLTDFAFTPDNGFFSLGKRGQVNWTSPDGAVRAVHRFGDVVTQQDLGAISITLGHRYGAAGVSPTVWIVRVRGAGLGESVLSEFPVRLNAAGEPTGLGAERRVVFFPNRFNTHSMNDVIVDPKDGTLWLSVGDSADFTRFDARAFDAQRRDSPYGRIMHIDPNGAGIRETNPEYDAANPQAWYSKTFAKGFRNPFRLRLHPTLGVPMVGDVGWNTTEEQNVVRRGGNYGWPCFEGNDRTPEYRDRAECAGVPNSHPPLFAYPRTARMGSASVAGLVYQGPGDGNGGYPSSYAGSYFWADYSGQKIFNMRLNDAGTGLVAQPVAAGWANNDGGDVSRRVGVPVSLKYAPNGDIAYADIGSNQVRRITYSAGNHAPDIVTAEARTIDHTRREVQFSASATDLDADPLTYRWTFGDGARADGPNPKHTYTGARADQKFQATLEVSDGTAVSRTTITVAPGNQSPTLELTTPPDSTTYRVGDPVQLSARATDPDDGALQVKWTSILYHCSGEFYCHRHPGAEKTGNTFTEAFTDHGDSTALEIRAEATDSAGVTVYQTWTANPKLRTLTVTNNMGAPISVNGVLGGTRLVTVGSTAGISVPANHEGITFASWSDGITQNSRELKMPDQDVSLQARYNSPIAQRYASDAALRTRLGAPVGPETGDAAGREQVYAAGRMYWSRETGVREVRGAILATYLAQGGPARLGYPTSDEIATPDGAGRMNRFAGTGAFPNPVIYWKAATGANLVMGSIKTQHDAVGATGGVHGYPRNSESTTRNGRAQYNDFENGGIYWSGSTGARSVYGAIHGKWGQYDWEGGFLGLPTTSELGTPNGAGRYNHFEGGSIYFSPASGVHELHGSIRIKWAALGWETSLLRFPTTDELAAAGGRFNEFQGGSIYWSPGSGAWEVHGLIRDEWRRRGAERSSLGYPVSDEFAVAGGRRSNFQRGYIEWVNGRLNVVVR